MNKKTIFRLNIMAIIVCSFAAYATTNVAVIFLNGIVIGFNISHALWTSNILSFEREIGQITKEHMLLVKEQNEAAWKYLREAKEKQEE